MMLNRCCSRRPHHVHLAVHEVPGMPVCHGGYLRLVKLLQEELPQVGVRVVAPYVDELIPVLEH